jgi:hypothetical protein
LRRPEETLKLIYKAIPKLGFKMLYKNTKPQAHKDRDSIACSKKLVDLGDYSLIDPTSNVDQTISAKIF